jgi:death-on-curing family protein
MRYPTLDDCRQILFPYIRSRLVQAEPAPSYEDEERGLQKLEGILGLMQIDEYDGALAKAAYLFCSVVDGHPFSNGNKRLGVTVLLFFLLTNGYLVSMPNLAVLRQELQRLFPALHWEDVDTFTEPHEYFFFHLALIIADRRQKGQMTFTQEQQAVKTLLEAVMVRA